MAKKSRKPESFLNRPQYPGGSKAMDKFIFAQLKYPEEAAEQKIDGLVRIRLDIDHKGKVIRSKVLQSLGFGCDEEAARVVRLLKFNVEHNRNMKVTFHKTLNIHFRPPGPKQPVSGVTYSISPKVNPPQSGKEKAPKTNSYNYTVKLDQQ